MLFGHIGEGNLHLNLVRCVLDADRERELYSAMMALIARLGGNVSSEHGVGTRKRDYVVNVAHRAGHRGDAGGQSGVRPHRLSQSRGAVRLVPPGRRMPAVTKTVVGIVAGMPAGRLEPERPRVRLLVAQPVP